MSTTTYRAVDGDRWDTVAFKAYGDASKYPLLIDANPGVPIRDYIDGGTILIVPVIDVPPLNQTNAALLPPWKR